MSCKAKTTVRASEPETIRQRHVDLSQLGMVRCVVAVEPISKTI